MKNITGSKRKGLSTVITTLIILVVAVLLAGVVTYYATNVVMTRTTQEEVRIRKPHIWVQEGDNAYAALMVQNLGGRDVLIDKLTIRGVDCPWGSVNVDITGEQIGIGDAGLTPTVSDFSKLPIIPGSVTIKATVLSTLVEITDVDNDDGTGALSGTDVSGTIVYNTGVCTLTFTTNGPDVDSSITASYTYSFVMVSYYLVSGEDVSADFELKETAGAVYAQIENVPAQADWEPTISDMPLKSSGSMLFFITDPTNIALNDVGTTISLTVYTSNAQWIVETIVQAAVIETVVP
ncbi:hypothetical protein ES703_78458 [subsurface metagenome]